MTPILSFSSHEFAKGKNGLNQYDCLIGAFAIRAVKCGTFLYLIANHVILETHLGHRGEIMFPGLYK